MIQSELMSELVVLSSQMFDILLLSLVCFPIVGNCFPIVGDCDLIIGYSLKSLFKSLSLCRIRSQTQFGFDLLV